MNPLITLGIGLLFGGLFVWIGTRHRIARLTKKLDDAEAELIGAQFREHMKERRLTWPLARVHDGKIEHWDLPTADAAWSQVIAPAYFDREE